MNDFKQQYEGLNNKLNTSNQTLEMLEKESVEKKKEYSDLKKEVDSKLIELRTLKAERQHILSAENKKIGRIMNIILLLITAGIIIAGYKVISAIFASNIHVLLKILETMLTVSIGGTLDFFALVAVREIERKINQKKCQKIANTDTKYMQLDKEIRQKEKEYKTDEKKLAELLNELNTLTTQISEQKNLIISESVELEQLRQEIIDFVIGTPSEVPEEKKAYVRVRSKNENSTN